MRITYKLAFMCNNSFRLFYCREYVKFLCQLLLHITSGYPGKGRLLSVPYCIGNFFFTAPCDAGEKFQHIPAQGVNRRPGKARAQNRARTGNPQTKRQQPTRSRDYRLTDIHAWCFCLRYQCCKQYRQRRFYRLSLL